MKSIDTIATDLFNKIRGRFPSVTIGDESGKLTNNPQEARFFDFDFKDNGKPLGKVSLSVNEDAITVMYSDNFVENENDSTRQNWYDFLKELRSFAKKRLLKFDTRDITKSNLTKRDYKFLAAQSGEQTMSESKLYGTSRVSYQNIGSARLNIKHRSSVDSELPASRTRNIDKIYIESAEGEKFKYPYKHLNGARALARHVAEGGNPYDEFGKHITGLSEELAKLRKFKNYMNRSSVMAEGLQDYVGTVNERIDDIKNTVQRLQRETFYKEAVEGFEAPVFEDIPDDVADNWIDQLTIRQFNEELKDVFPYVYRLVAENTKAVEITPEHLEEFDIMNPIDSIKNWHKGRMDKYDAEIKSLRMQAQAIDKNGALDAEATCNADPRDCLKQFIIDNGGSVEEGERHGNSKIYDKCWKGYRKVPGKKAGEKGSCKKIEGVELESLDSFFEGRDDAPEGDRITTDENPLVTSYDDEFEKEPGISGHMNLKTWMSIHAIPAQYQEQLAKAVVDGGRGKKISIPDEVKADYDAERDEAGLKPRALWIELSQHHEAEKASDNASEGKKLVIN